MYNSENKITSGSDTIDLNNEMKTPVKGIFIVAENQTALKYNYHSNYTDNSNDHRLGYHPIKTLSSRSSGGTRYKNMPYYHFSMAMPWFRMISAPSEIGYLADYFGYDPMFIHSDNVTPGGGSKGLVRKLFQRTSRTLLEPRKQPRSRYSRLKLNNKK